MVFFDGGYSVPRARYLSEKKTTVGHVNRREQFYKSVLSHIRNHALRNTGKVRETSVKRDTTYSMEPSQLDVVHHSTQLAE